MRRRDLLRWLLSGASAWPLRGVYLHAQATSLSAAGVGTLRALAAVVLPAEIGTVGHDKVVSDFVQWLASYRSGAERNWGYGSPRRSVTATIQSSTYDAQLRALDEAGRATGVAFTTMSVDARRAIVTQTLESAATRALPGSPNGGHVITDLMSFYFSSDAANDLTYRRRIGRASCRGLTGAAGRPPSTAGD